MFIEELELEADSVVLVPLQQEHADDLSEAACDGKLWDLWFTSVPQPESIDAYISLALQQQKDGLSQPFAVVNKLSGTVIGSTRFCNLDSKNKRVEIGYTWYAKSYQRSSVNTECKLALLKHAFEVLDVVAVEFRTHWHNLGSRKAIARLGAKQDGVLRQHQRLPDGSFRDTVVFSIIDSEWAGVKNNLTYKLASYRQ